MGLTLALDKLLLFYFQSHLPYLPWGGARRPPLAEIIIMQYFAYKTWSFFSSDFKDIVIWQLLVKKIIELFLGGPPPLAPSNEGNQEKWPPMTANDPHFLCQNPIILSNEGCLHKTRPKNIHFWSNGEQFCMIKKIFSWASFLF